MAWCDVHFCKAGFVEKRQHPSDSMADEFRITPLGVRERNRRPEKITVGYLQGFYRGKVHRGAGSDDTTSDAELALYDAFQKLPDAFTVLHAVKWFARERGTVGEIDFLIAHPGYGVLVLAGIPTEVIRQNLGHVDVKTTQDYIGVLDGSTRAPVSVYDASPILERLVQQT